MAEPDEKSLDAILERDEHDNAKLSESEFKVRLLPILIDQGDDGNLQSWLNVAGSWRRALDVQDDRTGEVLFTVPALVGGTGHPTLQTASNSAYDLIENAQKKMRVVPRAGDEMLVKGMTRRIRIEGDRKQAVEAWNHIYRRYGYDHLIAGTAKASETAASIGPGGSKATVDFSGYDEA